MKSSDWKTIVSTVAPTMAAALGGPFAGVAMNAICSALLGKEVTNADESVLADAVLTANPTTLVKLKKADQDFKLKMQQLDVEDRKSARDLAKVMGMAPQVTLSVIYTLGYFYLIYGLGSGTISIPENVEQQFTILLGIMTAAQAQIMNFWFGSSSGSKAKTNKLR